MPAISLVSPIIALIRPALGAVAGDISRRWRISRQFDRGEVSKTSPFIKKAIADLEILIGKNALLTTTVAAVLEELKTTGLLGVIARDAFYEIHDKGVRTYFEIIFFRHSSTMEKKLQHDACIRLYQTIQSLLRESIRQQIDPSLLFIFDNVNDEDEKLKALPPDDKKQKVISDIRPEVAKRVSLAGQTLLAFKEEESPSADLPGWFHLTSEHLVQQIKMISKALIPLYESVRLDGPAQRYL